MKVGRTSSELHPEGLFLFTPSDVAESKGTYGTQFKWRMQSTEARGDGEPFELVYFTGTVISDHPECKLTRLVQCCGLDPEEFDDTDDLLGKLFCGRVETNEKGDRSNIVKVFPKSKLQASDVKKTKVKAKSDDPFEEE